MAEIGESSTLLTQLYVFSPLLIKRNWPTVYSANLKNEERNKRTDVAFLHRNPRDGGASTRL